MLGFLSQDDLTAELLRRRRSCAPSLGGESFGMVLTRGVRVRDAGRCVGHRRVHGDVMTPETGVLVPPGDPAALAEALVELLADEARRRRSARGRAAHRRGALLLGRRSRSGCVEIYERRERAVPGSSRGGRVSSRLAHSRLRRVASSSPVAAVVVRAPLVARAGLERRRGRVRAVALGVGRGARSRSTSSRSSFARSRGRTVIEQAMPPPHPPASLRLLRLLRRAPRERGAARADRRARARRRADPPDARAPRALGDARRHRVRAPAVRPRAGARCSSSTWCCDREDPGLGHAGA